LFYQGILVFSITDVQAINTGKAVYKLARCNEFKWRRR